MVNSLIRPSYHQGFARGSLSKRPNLWKGLIGCWKPSLGCTGIKTLRDVSGFGNHGTLSGSMTLDDWVISDNSRNPGYALDLDGTDDSINCGSKDIFDNLEVFTLSTWINVPDQNAKAIVNKWDGLFEWMFMIISTLRIRAIANYDGENAQSITDHDVLTANTWNHVVFTFDVNGDAIIWVYIDGVKLTSYSTQTAATGTINDNSGFDLHIGSVDGTSNFFPGFIDDVRIYNRVLSPSEIWDTYQFPNAMFGFGDRVVGRAPFAETLTISVADCAGQRDILV